MPTENPTIPASARGVSMTRVSPKASRSPSVTRNTPPSTPTSSPRTMTRSSFSISCFKAKLSALIIVSLGMVDFLLSVEELLEGLSLRLQVRRPLGIEVVEHNERVAHALHLRLRLLPCLVDFVFDLGLQLRNF